VYNKKVNFYYFDQVSTAPLTSISKELDEAGFYGMLVPYTVGASNHFIETTRALDTKQKLKYIIGVRPHTVSPQYLAMMIKSINDIQPGRVWVNFVAGLIREDEIALKGSMFPEEFERSWKERKLYLSKYIPIFKDFCNTKEIKTKICMAGMTDEVFSLVEKNADYNICAYEPYIRMNGFRKISKPRIISICPFIEDNQEIIDVVRNDKDKPQDIIFTTTQGLTDIINNLKAEGINDILLFSYGNNSEEHDKEKYKIIDFVKEYKANHKEKSWF
jgi:hypothetical protein